VSAPIAIVQLSTLLTSLDNAGPFQVILVGAPVPSTRSLLSNACGGTFLMVIAGVLALEADVDHSVPTKTHMGKGW
jgi:hypothetical protein